jgi:formylmethanofuran dehydrogenase subunit E
VTASSSDVRCPRCGEGTLVDISFDLDTEDPRADGAQDAESRQIETYSCGHTVVGPRLSSADQEVMTVERRTSDETTMPAPDLSTPSADGVRVPGSVEEQEDLVEEASEESFPASDPPSYWAREAPDTP